MAGNVAHLKTAMDTQYPCGQNEGHYHLATNSQVQTYPKNTSPTFSCPNAPQQSNRTPAGRSVLCTFLYPALSNIHRRPNDAGNDLSGQTARTPALGASSWGSAPSYLQYDMQTETTWASRRVSQLCGTGTPKQFG